MRRSSFAAPAMAAAALAAFAMIACGVIIAMQGDDHVYEFFDIVLIAGAVWALVTEAAFLIAFFAPREHS